MMPDAYKYALVNLPCFHLFSPVQLQTVAETNRILLNMASPEPERPVRIARKKRKKVLSSQM